MEVEVQLLQAVRIRAPITRMRTGTQVRWLLSSPSPLCCLRSLWKVWGSEFWFRMSLGKLLLGAGALQDEEESTGKDSGQGILAAGDFRS